MTRDRLHLEKADRIDKYIISLFTPPVLARLSSENDIIRRRKEFSSLCVALKNLGIQDPHKQSVFEFNVAMSYHEKKNKS